MWPSKLHFLQRRRDPLCAVSSLWHCSPATPVGQQLIRPRVVTRAPAASRSTMCVYVRVLSSSPPFLFSAQQQGYAGQNASAVASSSTSLTGVFGSQPSTSGGTAGVNITYTPGSGMSEEGLTVPTTAITSHCNILSESLSKADELLLQQKAQKALGVGAEILTAEGIDEMMEELLEVTTSEVETLVGEMRSTPVLQQAGMHELRRTLYYATSLKARDWILAPAYTAMMRMLTVEILRRDNDGVLAADDVLYITTHMVAANFYNRHLWNRMERTLEKYTIYENIDLPTIKALTTKLFKTRRGCPKETLDMRRKLLNAMSLRISVLANDFDLPSLLGVMQCYSVHDMTPRTLEPLVIRATNHIGEFTPHECATLSHLLRRFRLMQLEVCERVVERICTSDELNHHMAVAALVSIRTCYNRVSDSGRGALHAEPMRQKLRAMGEQVGCRLDEVQFPALATILSVLDIIVTMKIYVPKKALQSIFAQASTMIAVVIAHQNDLVDPETGKRVRPITMEEGRQLQALLFHYGSDLCPELCAQLKEALREGMLPDEASI